MTGVIIYSPTFSGWLIFAVPTFVHPVVPLVQVPGAASLGITACCIGLVTVVTERSLTILGVVTDIGSMGVAVILNLPPSGLVSTGGVGVWCRARIVAGITNVTGLD